MRITKNFKKLIAIFSVMMMVLSMAACGQTAEEPVEVEEEEEEDVNDPSDPEPVIDSGVIDEPPHYPGAELARKNVYDVEYVNVSGIGTYPVLSSYGKTEDGVWIVFKEYEGNNTEDATLIEIDNDGNVKTNHELKDSPYNDPESLLDEYKIKYSYVDFRVLENYQYLDGGVIEGIFSIVSYDSKDKRSVNYFDVRWDENGELLGTSHLPINVGNYGYDNRMIYTEDDELLVIYDYDGDEGYNVRAVLLGENRYDTPDDSIITINNDISEWGYSFGSMIAREDGIYVLRWSNAFSGDELVEGKINLDDLTMTLTGSIPQLGKGSSYCIGYTDDQYIFSHYSGIECCSMDEKARIFLDFANSDICSMGFNCVIPLEGLDKIFAVDYELIGGAVELMILTAKDSETIEEQPVITVAYNYPGVDLAEMIYNFNTSNNGYRIVVKDYSLFEDPSQDITWNGKLQQDMLNGLVCDIICCEYMDDLDFRLLAEKGIFADIGGLIANDPDMSMDDYAYGVFEAAAIDGKLFQIIPYFSVETFMGSDRFFNGYENWSVDDFLEMTEAVEGNGGHMFDPYVTRVNFLENMMHITGSSWVNLDERTCDFTDPSFMRLLGYAMSLPDYTDYEDGWVYDYWDRSAEMGENGEVRLFSTRISHTKYLLTEGYSRFNELPVIAGFPSPNSMGSSIYYCTSYMLNADSEYLDVCWDFMKPFLQTAYQNDTYMMPVLLDALKADVDECDADDEYENSRPTYYINDEELELPYISDEAKENFYDQISSINALYFTNKDIIAIVEDTVMAGCENGSTPEEIASSIQVQVQDYLS